MIPAFARVFYRRSAILKSSRRRPWGRGWGLSSNDQGRQRREKRDPGNEVGLGPNNFLLVRSEHAHASYPGLFFRPPGFSPYMGREERSSGTGLGQVRNFSVFPSCSHIQRSPLLEVCGTQFGDPSFKICLEGGVG